MNAPRTEPGLGDGEAGPLLAEYVGTRHPTILVADLRMAGPVVARVTHARDVADDAEARRVGRDDNLAGAAVRLGLRIGYCHDDGEGGAVGAGGEPLVPVD